MLALPFTSFGGSLANLLMYIFIIGTVPLIGSMKRGSEKLRKLSDGMLLCPSDRKK
jgi:hypothetical protein